jgi:hypothetical protein
MNKWELEFWESESGNCPVKDFLNELKLKDSLSHERVLEKIKRFTTWRITDLCKSGHLEKIKSENLYEFKVSVSGIEFRFLGRLSNTSLDSGELIILCTAHAIKKKTNKLKNKDIKIAADRLNSKK